MKNSTDKNELVRKRNKKIVIFINIGAAIIVAVDTDFFQLPLTDGRTIIAICFWITMFLISMTRSSISEEGIKFYVLFVRIRFIKPKRISRIEIIPFGDLTHIVFELDKCPRYAGGNMMFLDNYLMVHPFRVIDYAVMEQQTEEAINWVESMFGDKEIITYTKDGDSITISTTLSEDDPQQRVQRRKP